MFTDVLKQTVRHGSRCVLSFRIVSPPMLRHAHSLFSHMWLQRFVKSVSGAYNEYRKTCKVGIFCRTRSDAIYKNKTVHGGCQEMKAQEWGSLLLLSDVSPRLCCCIGLNDEWRDRS